MKSHSSNSTSPGRTSPRITGARGGGSRRRSRAGAQFALLPEMFSTGFSMDSARIAQPEGGPSETFLRSTARELSMWILASVPEAGEPRPRNMALLAAPDGSVQRYAKIHPFTFGGEHRVYDGGDRVITARVGDLAVTPFVCYDLRFPEPFRLAAPETDLFAVVANWPDARREAWRTLLRARAIENLCFVAGVNRAGEGGGLRYAGDSALDLAVGRGAGRGGTGRGSPRRRRGSRRGARRPREVPGARGPAPGGVPPLSA